MPNNYGDKQYWDQRYRKSIDERFDWLEDFQGLRACLEQLLPHDKHARILNVGCGNSEFQDHLYELGYHQIVNNDISEVVIEQMNKLKAQKNYHQMIYEVMDVRKMSYGHEQFDLVLDKSTLDMFMCSENPIINSAQSIGEIYRVLKPGGIYLVISYGSPLTRMEHLQRQHVAFDISFQTKQRNANGETRINYLYICRKIPMVPKTPEELKKYYEQLKEIEKRDYGSE